MKKSLFDFTDYRSYLLKALPTRGDGRGSRTRLAAKLGVQKGFISSILCGRAHLSLEQALRTSQVLAHLPDERDYFLLLVQKSRAGSKDLETHYADKIRQIAEQRRQIQGRIRVKNSLSDSDQVLYYSTWHYTAIHMCLCVPTLQTAPAISQRLGIPQSRVSEVLEFFVKTGVARQSGASYRAGPTRLHIGENSPHVNRHHTHWRMKAIQSLDEQGSEDLHYSSVMSISKETMRKLREILLSAIQQTEPEIQAAKDEEVVCLALDLFELNYKKPLDLQHLSEQRPANP